MDKNSIVTVFGASGFVGRHAIRAMAKQGWRIRAVTRRPNLANHLLPAGNVGQIQLLKGNVNNDEDVARAVRGAGAVLNLTGVLFGQSFDGVHVEAARRIAKACRNNGVEALVHLSAIGADPEGGSAYAQSKGNGEKAVREAYPDATILRPSLIFGPEDQFFNKFAGMARLFPVLPLVGGGQTRFQPVYVADIATAIVNALTLQEARGQTYELGGPSVYTFKELLQFILHETGRHNLLVPVPFGLAIPMALGLSAARAVPELVRQIFKAVSPPPLLTMDQVRMLKGDAVVHDGARGLGELGIKPASMESVVPSYLWRFHPKGQFRDQGSPVTQ